MSDKPIEYIWYNERTNELSVRRALHILEVANLIKLGWRCVGEL